MSDPQLFPAPSEPKPDRVSVLMRAVQFCSRIPNRSEAKRLANEIERRIVKGQDVEHLIKEPE